MLIDYDKGSFDETGYIINHIKEYCETGNDSIDNLQALCRTCHITRIRNFIKYKQYKEKIKKKIEDL